MPKSNSILSPYEILPILQENKYLRKFSYFIMQLYVLSTYHYCLKDKKIPKLSPFASWPGVMINPQWLELPSLYFLVLCNHWSHSVFFENLSGSLMTPIWPTLANLATKKTRHFRISDILYVYCSQGSYFVESILDCFPQFWLQLPFAKLSS